jgi:hypothetical protein
VLGIQVALANSGEAAGDISTLYQQVLGRTAPSGDVSFWQGQLAAGTSLAGVRSQLAHSGESQGHLTTAYQAAYGTAPSQNALGWLENQLATGAATLAQIQSTVQNPLIIDTVANQGTTDRSTDQPFAVAIVSDPQTGQTETAIITLTNAGGTATDANGTLSGSGLTHTGAGSYTLSNSTPAGLTTALEALVFTPTPGEVSIGQSVTTNLSLAVANNALTGTDGTTSITALAVGAPATLNFMYGSIGSDAFTATASADVFGENLNPLGTDVITGFSLAQDMVQVSVAQFANFAAVQAALTSSGGSAVLHLDSSNSVTLTGVTVASLQAANFRFV